MTPKCAPQDKTLKQLWEEENRLQAIEEGDLDKEDDLEFQPNAFEPTWKAVRKWLKATHQEWIDILQYEEMFVEEVIPRLLASLERDTPKQEEKL